MNGKSFKNLSAGLVAFAALASSASSDTVVVGGAALMPDGTISTDINAVLIAGDGTIAAVGKAADLVSGADDVDRYPGAVLSPGLIELASQVGIAGESRSSVGPVEPDVAAIDAFDASSGDLDDAIAQGVTGVMIAPTPTNAVSGRAAFVRTDGTPLITKGALICSVAPGAVNTLYGPSSRAGVVFELRRAFGAAPTGSAMALARSGEISTVLFCGSADDAQVGLGALVSGGVKPAIALRTGGLDLTPALKNIDYSPATIAGPYGYGDRPETLASTGAMSRNGSLIGFTNAGLSPDALRRSAALAVRYGLKPEAARRGLTSDAARIAGVDGMTGSLHAGSGADIAVFTLDPLRPDAAVVAVYIAGELVHEGAAMSGDALGGKEGNWEVSR